MNSYFDLVILMAVFLAGVGLGMAVSHNDKPRLEVKAVNSGYCGKCNYETRVIIMETRDVRVK